jgi:hypothetical protein
LSFLGILVLMMIVTLLEGIIQHFVLRRQFPTLFNQIDNKHSSHKNRLDANMQLNQESLKHLTICKISKFSCLWGLTLLILWLIVVVLISLGSIVFKNEFCIEILNCFK